MDELHPACRWSAEHSRHQPVERGTIARDGAFKLKIFPLRHNGHSVVADITTQNNLVARPRAVCRNVHVALDHANARGGNKYLVALAAIHNLGVAGHKRYPGLRGGCTHGFHHTPQIVHGQAFLENEGS